MSAQVPIPWPVVDISKALHAEVSTDAIIHFYSNSECVIAARHFPVQTQGGRFRFSAFLGFHVGNVQIS